MTIRTRIALMLGPTVVAGVLLVACTPAALAGILGFATVAAPVAGAALDLAAQQQRAAVIAPGATVADLAEIARRLDDLERCDATVHAMTAADAGPTDAQRLEAALIDSAAASRGLVDALAAARVGKDGGM